MTVTSTNQKVQFNGNGSTTVFAYNFKIFASSDLSVILRSAAGTETVQQLTTNYTVSGVGETSGGNVTMGTAPASGTTLTILRVQPNLQGLDLVPNDPFPAGSMEDALDKLTFMVQTHDEEIGRSIKASKTNVIADSEFTVSATDRANKLFSFDSSGNLSIAQELGTYRGDWAASTTYAVRDLVKDTSTGNIFICITAHTSSGSQPLTTNTDAAKWALIVDAASATTSQNAAAASATASANSATASASSASTASTKADEAAASASTASTKAGESASSATAAASSATSAASTLTTFQQQYHGAASSDPTSNLTEGDLYFKTGSGGGMRVYNGSAWVNAAFDLSGALINTNNLSDVSNAATALTNLGVTSTAAELNKLDALSRGSLIYGNASAATAVLTKGGAGTVLTSDGTDLSWASPAVGFAHTLNSGNPAITTNPSAIGHMWINTTSGEAFICTNATANSNVWVSLGVGSTPTIEPFNATGGIKTTYGIYTVHTFLSSANFVAVSTTTKTFDYLIVAGGGGGGCANGGGGGGGSGGLLTGSVSKSGGTTYSVVVGAGGAGGAVTGSGRKGVAGSNSSVFSLTAIGGGFGGGDDNHGGGNGGSGGGGARSTSGNGGTATSGQGNAGGSAIANVGGGGGGAGANGSNGVSGTGGAGGVGLSNSLRTGSGVFYAGGGGGGIESSNQHGTGGNGGGGDGGDHDEAPLAGTANTGGGGGGSGDYDNPTTPFPGAAGGSGIVVIRYET